MRYTPNCTTELRFLAPLFVSKLYPVSPFFKKRKRYLHIINETAKTHCTSKGHHDNVLLAPERRMLNTCMVFAIKTNIMF